MKYCQTLLFLFLSINLLGQFNPKPDKYQHYSIIKKKDTINFHLYSNDKIENTNSILLFLQGSGPEPFMNIKKEGKMTYIKSHIPFDLEKIPKNFVFVVISKKGIPFSTINSEFKATKLFYENESLEYRANQANEVLKYLIRNLVKKPKKIIAIGHSEGSDVAAKLGTINKDLTHIGFWSGDGNTQYYDFTLFIRKEIQKGTLTENQGKVKMDSLLNQLKEIEADENSISKFWEGHTFRRWTKFSEAAIDNLLQIKIPIFVTACGKDESVPIESTYLIPIEFIRHKKNNLTFKVYPDYDHSFIIWQKNKPEYHWMDVFEEFMKWTND
ncbi:dienelactone hydrolase family protein [Flavobacterium sp. LT1R49]|uniref:dienelactone hydrolase family protein n=1 Tax=Flavobacterium arabinosi TaxID=3398737 RepID=UPI003A84215B